MLLSNGLLLLKMYAGIYETSRLSLFFFPEMRLNFLMFIPAACFLFLLIVCPGRNVKIPGKNIIYIFLQELSESSRADSSRAMVYRSLLKSN